MINAKDYSATYPLISVIVPVYNVEKYLHKCIDSILRQTYQNLEIILVDDGSTDASPAICDEYAEQDNRVRVIHKENGGQSSARNAGLDAVTGDYIGFVDSDDWIAPVMYEKLLMLCLHTDAEIACCGRYDVDSISGQKKQGYCPREEGVISADEMMKKVFLMRECDSALWDKLFARRLFSEIRFPIGKRCEDIAKTYKTVAQTNRVALCPEPLYYYNHRAGSATTSKFNGNIIDYIFFTEKILKDVEEHYPGVYKEAKYLRVRSVESVLTHLSVQTKEIIQIYRDLYDALLKELRSSLGFWAASPYFTARERIKYCMLLMGIYPCFQQVRIRLKIISV